MSGPLRKVVTQSAREYLEAVIAAHELLLSNAEGRQKYRDCVFDDADPMGEFLREIDAIVPVAGVWHGDDFA